ncbi:Aste57867_14632 [Aphanomyces stellatus]|uniref:Aste57867_14632 protein n=1 Tax=Aphanomyces stellatus TaxID=120398 RepID=A0A485L1R6_9STRA|nr:hypothetical protein As57867_014577 [Aphanomyces stellatus]VFT91451.1 Aste57867_14632 [Aphanomyces stellatus]
MHFSWLPIVAVAVAATLSVSDAAGPPKTYKNVVSFLEWSTLARQFQIWDLDWSTATHINYAFAKPLPDGTVSIYDEYSSINKHYPARGDSWNDVNNLFGTFGQANKLKKQFRGTKLGYSIGGWTLSTSFSSIAANATSRQTFAKSAVQLLLDLGLDFLDIDWEYPVEGGNGQPAAPHSPDDMKNFILLLQTIRAEYAKLPFKAELSVSSPALPENYRHWDVGAICGLVDHVNLMSYDFSGSWSSYTDHQANLYADPNHPVGSTYSVDGAVQGYIQGGCPSDKIILGIPSNGRSFENTKGLYANFTQPTKGSWVYGTSGAGVWDYKALPLANATEYYNEKLVAAYSYDPTTQMFISYESPKSLAAKLDYIKKHNLGGTGFWSADSDGSFSNPRSLINQAFNYFGKTNLAFNLNNINYPTSKYPNVATNGTWTAAPTTVTPQPTPKPTVSPPTPAPTPDVCKGNKNVCYWPQTNQVIPYGQSDCALFPESFVWCP